MTTLSYLSLAAAISWWVSEIVIAVLRHSRPWSIGKDKLSYWFIWLSFLVSILASVGLSKLDKVGRIVFLAPLIGYAGCLVIAAGVCIRWVAVVTLGRQFTLQVTIVKDHRIVDHGIYKSLRHPAYLGSLMSFIGLGLAIENWIGLIVVFTLPLAAILYRIKVEERALLEHFGTQYEEYCKRTKRLLPRAY
jgi:protein-S-isoprenylcysteine O-methyltransferase Ste14